MHILLYRDKIGRSDRQGNVFEACFSWSSSTLNTSVSVEFTHLSTIEIMSFNRRPHSFMPTLTSEFTVLDVLNILKTTLSLLCLILHYNVNNGRQSFTDIVPHRSAPKVSPVCMGRVTNNRPSYILPCGRDSLV